MFLEPDKTMLLVTCHRTLSYGADTLKNKLFFITKVYKTRVLLVDGCNAHLVHCQFSVRFCSRFNVLFFMCMIFVRLGHESNLIFRCGYSSFSSVFFFL